MTNVLIVEDERLVREMLCQYICVAADRYKLVDAIKNAADAELFCMKTQVDLILMDICTAGNSSGLDVAEKIKLRFPKIKIIILTSAPDYRFIEKAIKAGAESFWYKDLSEDDLLTVMDKTMSGMSVYPETTPSVDFGFTDSSHFTPKELETLYWLVKVGSISVIAEKMGISVDGVNKHIRDLKEKTGITNTNQLALAARGNRLILPDYQLPPYFSGLCLDYQHLRKRHTTALSMAANCRYILQRKRNCLRKQAAPESGRGFDEKFSFRLRGQSNFEAEAKRILAKRILAERILTERILTMKELNISK